LKETQPLQQNGFISEWYCGGFDSPPYAPKNVFMRQDERGWGWCGMETA
jgi:hypothetical protein